MRGEYDGLMGQGQERSRRSQKQKVTLPIGFQHWTTALPEIVGKSGNQKELVPPFLDEILRSKL